MEGPLIIEQGSTYAVSGMINPGFAVAAMLALITFGVHTFVGGIFVARPLLRARDLTPASRWLNYYTWHMATALLLVMTAGFVWAAVSREAAEVGMLLTGMAALFSPLCVGVALKGGIAPWRFPAATLFLIITFAGIWGLSEYVIPPPITVHAELVPAT